MRDMQQHMVITAMLGGLLGTLGQMLLVYGVAPLIAGHTLEVAALRDCPCAPSLLLHLLSGSVLLPLGFLALPAHDMPGPPMLRGMLWAGCLWLVLETLRRPTARCWRLQCGPGRLPSRAAGAAGVPGLWRHAERARRCPSTDGPGDGTTPVRRPQGGRHRPRSLS